MKVGQVAAIFESLSAVIKDASLNGGAMYRTSKVIQELGNIAKPFLDTRDSLIQRYGKDGSIDPDSDNWAEFVKDLNDASADDVDVGVKIKVSDIDELKITGHQMMVLMDILEE